MHGSLALPPLPRTLCAAEALSQGWKRLLHVHRLSPSAASPRFCVHLEQLHALLRAALWPRDCCCFEVSLVGGAAAAYALGIACLGPCLPSAATELGGV